MQGPRELPTAQTDVSLQKDLVLWWLSSDGGLTIEEVGPYKAPNLTHVDYYEIQSVYTEVLLSR